MLRELRRLAWFLAIFFLNIAWIEMPWIECRRQLVIHVLCGYFCRSLGKNYKQKDAETAVAITYCICTLRNQKQILFTVGKLALFKTRTSFEPTLARIIIFCWNITKSHMIMYIKIAAISLIGSISINTHERPYYILGHSKGCIIKNLLFFCIVIFYP